MSHWVQLCPASEAPAEGEVMELEAEGVAICLVRHNGQISALGNWCPHRNGPLGQGWLEGNAVICPWHSWAFNLESGVADPPERAKVPVFPVRLEGEQVLVEID